MRSQSFARYRHRPVSQAGREPAFRVRVIVNAQVGGARTNQGPQSGRDRKRCVSFLSDRAAGSSLRSAELLQESRKFRALCCTPLSHALSKTRERALPCVGLPPRTAAGRPASPVGLVDRFGSAVPSDFASLVSLPGVGPKTAAVVLATAFGVPAFPVDTHVHRCAARWGLCPPTEADPSVVSAHLRAAFPRPSAWIKLHLQVWGNLPANAPFHPLCCITTACRTCR